MTGIYYDDLDAQLNIDYQQPHDDILRLVDAPLPPQMSMNNEGDQAILLYRRAHKTIDELSRPEMRLGGLRINPATNTNSRQRYFYKISLLDTDGGTENEIKGLPSGGQYANMKWSNDETHVALTHTSHDGLYLWLIDLDQASARQLSELPLNGNIGTPYTWAPDGRSLLAKVLPADQPRLTDRGTAIPNGPTVSVNEGSKAQNRTYQDLLKNHTDEANFDILATSTIVKISIDGTVSDFLPQAIYRSMTYSPDGSYLLVNTVHQPYSYLVPYYRFPSQIDVYTSTGSHVSTVQSLPLIEELPKGFMATHTYMRNINWRNDQAATLYYVKAADGGDPKNKVAYRDIVYQMESPFDAEGEQIAQCHNRFSYIDWCDSDNAILHDRWWNTRNTKAYHFAPDNRKKEAKMIWDHNYQDRYNDPGYFVSEKNSFGRYTAKMDKGKMYLIAPGYSAEGIHPTVDAIDLASGSITNLYRSDLTEQYERIRSSLDISKGEVLVSIESSNDYPDYYLRNIYTGDLRPVTQFDNPFQSIADVHKEVVQYKRADGVDLSATLYLPQGYDQSSGERLPMLMWAYPREYKDKSSAGQITSSPYQFTHPSFGSPIFWVTRGYAVLDRASFPIIGEGDTEPNDSFVEQLVANARAGIDAIDALGYIDRRRIAVGGHSYGAFMTANLLSHSDLFAAGIARSGAYNRTLTPFGFQAEERNYWEAPEIYNKMSPFMNAEKMKTPLLLIHGEADNNSGTYPMQSERYFNALKGLGATVRLVMLPKESHGYAARESILHMLWEQDQWLEEHVKNRDDEIKP